MYWTLELASKLEDAPWPATKDELIDYAMRSGAPFEMCIRDRGNGTMTSTNFFVVQNYKKGGILY